MKAQAKALNNLSGFDLKRDAYGFAVRPQHVQRYREYANIYKEEEEERSDRWNTFLDRLADSAQLPVNGPSLKEPKSLATEATGEEVDDNLLNGIDGDNLSDGNRCSDVSHDDLMEKEEKQTTTNRRIHRIQIWTETRPSLRVIEDMMSVRVKKKVNQLKEQQDDKNEKPVSIVEDVKSPKGVTEGDSEDEFYDVERSDPIPDVPPVENVVVSATAHQEDLSSWKEELEVLVRGGVPMALRGELWQAFVGVKARRTDKYYQELLASETKPENHADEQSENDTKSLPRDPASTEKWKGQIEKDLPRTFPGHPALDNDGRNALRRLLTAYARHNPSVGYCQAMNFFAALLLLLMPEENAFWTLMGILDDYFDGYYSEEMIESQVDQLVFEELVRERFPKLVNHLDYLGVQVAWVTGPWFLSIFMNMLPWESVLRVWDVLLFEGNRVMLLRTALALMELYGPALVTTKDAGDAVTLLQSLASSTFDSSQLVLTASMGFQNVNEARLRELSDKHRPAVMAALEERTKGIQAWRDSKGLASKLYNFKHDPKSMLVEGRTQTSGDLSRSESGSTNSDDVLISLTENGEMDSAPDLQEQVELCKLLEEKRSALLRADELETALMEMVKQDNRRQLSARVEQLEQEISDLRKALSEKQEQENAMIQVLMRVEQEQKVTEDARRYAEQDAQAQRYACQVLQEKYEEAMASLGEMEKRVVMAESMLEATLQYQSGQLKKQLSSPRVEDPDKLQRVNSNEDSTRKSGLFGFGWRDRNKGKATNGEEGGSGNLENGKPPSNDEQTPPPTSNQNGSLVQDQ
ncbi:TBC1 domain family member 8B [Linum grandiflorum]